MLAQAGRKAGPMCSSKLPVFAAWWPSPLRRPVPLSIAVRPYRVGLVAPLRTLPQPCAPRPRQGHAACTHQPRAGPAHPCTVDFGSQNRFSSFCWRKGEARKPTTAMAARRRIGRREEELKSHCPFSVIYILTLNSRRQSPKVAVKREAPTTGVGAPYATGMHPGRI